MKSLHNSKTRGKLTKIVNRCVIAILMGLALTLLPLSKPASGQGAKPKEKRIEVRMGELVKLDVEQLRIKSKSFARAIADREKRGHKPDWSKSLTIISTEQNSIALVNGGYLRPASYLQDTISDGTNQMTFITYDNGNPNTWEGTVYIHTSANGDENL
ncbi:MAG TPA: hypothetical protein VNN73_05725 [Blastocatellia bacterium]|nr:hypothetical protein [Blastocatellia bacterium]